MNISGNLKRGYRHFLRLSPKMKKQIYLDFQKIFDNPLAKYLISKEFLECIGYISSYLQQSE